jgi:hypothetical protein
MDSPAVMTSVRSTGSSRNRLLSKDGRLYRTFAITSTEETIVDRFDCAAGSLPGTNPALRYARAIA